MKNSNKEIYDLIIIGGGPAGLSAALYATRYKLNALILTKDLGGTLLIASDIANFPGQEEIKAADLVQIFIERVKNKVKIVKEEVEKVEKSKKEFLIKTKTNNFKAKAIILATGASRKKLQVKGEKDFERRGVSYCAICDAPLFRSKKVAVIGGGNSALHAAMMLSRYAKEVFILARRDLRADPILVDQIQAIKNIKVVNGVNIKEIQGKIFIQKIVLDKKIKGKDTLDLEGIFIEVGVEPNTGFVKNLKTKKDKEGFIKVNEKMETNIPGLYAVGDISTGSAGLRQVITASSEGAIAATSVYNKLKK